LKKTEKATQDYWDNADKALKKSQDAQKKAIEDKYKGLAAAYDADIKQAEDAAKAKTDAINDEIKALQKDDQARQKLFQNETNRIERLAQMQNDAIDFNSAMNSGNIDEAAKLMNNATATQTGWMLLTSRPRWTTRPRLSRTTYRARLTLSMRQRTLTCRPSRTRRQPWTI
jgi:DnaJ-class molecular chaperone